MHSGGRCDGHACVVPSGTRPSPAICEDTCVHCHCGQQGTLCWLACAACTPRCCEPRACGPVSGMGQRWATDNCTARSLVSLSSPSLLATSRSSRSLSLLARRPVGVV